MSTQDNGEIALLCEILQARGRTWTTAPRICVAAQSADETLRWIPRHVSELAAASRGRILACGAGYMLADCATEQDAQRAYDELHARASATEQRAVDVLRYYHRRREIARERDQAARDRELQPELAL